MGEVIKLNTEQYGEKLFKKWAKSISKNCGGIQIFTRLSYRGHPLIDHPLIVDCVPVWSKGKLNGHEFAMICRTYATDDAIDNPPEGLKTWRLPKEVLGTSPGTAIAVMIDDNTPMTRLQFSFKNLLFECEAQNIDVREKIQILASPDFDNLQKSIINGDKASKLKDKGEIL